MARKNTTTTTTKKITGKRISPKRLLIAGLPIEDITHEIDYPDTQGEDLGDYIEGASHEEQLAADTKTIKARKIKAPAAPREYQGAPMTASRVYTRQMGEFKNTRADTWLLVNDEAGTFSTANTYKAGILPPSHRPEKYTWPMDAKAVRKVAAKIEQMTEVSPHEWPSWITPATKATATKTTTPAKRTRKAK